MLTSPSKKFAAGLVAGDKGVDMRREYDV